MNLIPRYPSHDFNEKLNESHAASDLDIWERIYKKAFPGFLAMADHRQSGWHQHEGIDRSITLSNSKQILVDEKIRNKDYGDILLEYLSNDQTKAPGWVCKPLMCDYICYAILPSEMAYLLPVIQLQIAWENNKDVWQRKYGKKPANNKTYRTWSTPVPINELFRAIGNGLRISFKK